ncbi:cytosol aminopeptidase isoform X3 [Erythrolamprus reginae]|uniref:cytosol aminopeptidase isoform X3 n=1 Tax=Erythrolamprus reginae TaxID=121349 RepID=UPI00396C7991
MILRLLLARVRCSLVAHPPRTRFLLAPSMTTDTRAATVRQGLILGAFASDDEPSQLSDAGEAFDKQVNGKLKELLALSGPPLKKGKNRIFHGLHQTFSNVVVVGLGKKGIGMNIDENWNEDKENIRAAVAAGCRQLQDLELPYIEVDPCGDAQAAAEGATLSIFEYEELKQKKKPTIEIQLHGSDGVDAWQKGICYAEGQNMARYLMEGPANHITPTKFATIIEDKLKSFSSHVIVHKSGGISIKPSANMDAMRADMGGAATIFSAIVTAAELKLPINLIGLAPLCENLPSGRANKPGDVVTAMNGKTIQIDNTDAEGRLVLADALHYAHRFNPRAILDTATLTGAMDVALGSAATGVFTNSQRLWHHLYEASVLTGDRVWRMPLFEHYTKQMTDCHLADINNIGKYRSGGACTAAAFLKEFVTAPHWAHLDIAGVMENKDEVPYLRKGMAGRPTRTLVEFITRLALDKQSF